MRSPRRDACACGHAANPETRIRALVSDGALRDAATAAVETYGPSIWRYVCTLVEDEEDARDVFQTFAEDLWRGLASFRGDSSLRTWAYRVAWAASSRHRRDAFRRRRRRLATDDMSRMVASVTTHATPGGRHDALARLRRSLGKDDQLLLTLRVDRELSWDDIAALLSATGKPLEAPALRKRYERLKDELRERARADGLVD
jgi:RNA polymerase sigma-70 factor, ECF subfamily